jgi:hypothetical protein
MSTTTDNKTKVPIIKPVLGTTRITDTDFVARLNAIHDKMNGNPAYPNPPVDMPGFKTAIDAFSTAIAAALDGGKNAMAARDKARADVTVMFRLLGHYVEVACKDDMNTFVSSGFVAVTPRQKPTARPVAVPSITAVDQGNTGQLVVTIKPVAKARSYDIHYAPAATAGAAINWTTITVATAKPAPIICNLTPGTTYTFQVRAFGKLGYSDWIFQKRCIKSHSGCSLRLRAVFRKSRKAAEKNS